MRHKTSGYFLLSALLVSLILGLCILLNLRCPQAVSDDALTQEQLTRGVTLTADGRMLYEYCLLYTSDAADD